MIKAAQQVGGERRTLPVETGEKEVIEEDSLVLASVCWRDTICEGWNDGLLGIQFSDSFPEFFRICIVKFVKELLLRFSK